MANNCRGRELDCLQIQVGEYGEKMYLKNMISTQFLKFCFMGSIYYLTSALLMFVSYNVWNFNYWVSSIISFCLISIIGFFINKYKVFNSKGKTFTTFIRFVICIACVYILSFCFTKYLLDSINYNIGNLSREVIENISMLVSSTIFTLINYTFQKHFVFK